MDRAASTNSAESVDDQIHCPIWGSGGTGRSHADGAAMSNARMRVGAVLLATVTMVMGETLPRSRAR